MFQLKIFFFHQTIRSNMGTYENINTSINNDSVLTTGYLLHF